MLTEHIDDSIREIADWRASSSNTTGMAIQYRGLFEQLERLTRAACVAAGRDYDAEMAAAVLQAGEED